MEGASKGRLIAFRVVCGITVVLSLLTVFYAVGSFIDEKAAMHRVHNTSMAIAWILLAAVPLVLAARSPSKAVSGFRVWLGLCLAGVVAGILSGDLFEPEGQLITVILAVLTYALNPAMKDVNRCVKANVVQLGMSVVALVPAFIYAMSQADLQKAGDPAVNEHVKYHHYAGMGWIALAFGLCGIAASFPGTGRLLASRLLGTAAVLVGILSLVQSNYEGSYDTPWAIAVIAFGILYCIPAEMDAKKTVGAESAQRATATG